MQYLEYNEQKAVVKWFIQLQKIGLIAPYVLLYANRNTHYLNIKQQGRAKCEGMISGIPDLFLTAQANGYSGMYIEMKSQKGKLSLNQKEIIEKLKKCGYYVTICYSANEAIIELIKYLNLKI